jgi:OmpA-OmpF porin, OOP family
MRFPFLIILPACLFATAAAAQAEAEQPFRVFFDWAKPELTRDAQATLDEAVAGYQRLRPGRIVVAGHADRSGSSGHNLAASRRRAEAVKAYLVRHGVPASAITLSALGESRPIVPTEDGVREAQNRRVEISFKGAAASP